jgi:phosphoribosylamine--glycine ligase
MMTGKQFGAAGDELVIESFLSGEEASFFAIIDGKTALPLIAAQDHKRVGDGDTGPNTGGMGAYSPAPVVSDDVAQKILDRCITPLVETMAREGTPYRGVLFAGLMIENGEPTLIEYNVRFGDPECQVLMARLDSDIVELMLAACNGKLAGHKVAWKPEPAMVVVMAAAGYPGSYRKGGVIGGLHAANQVPGVKVLHAGTSLARERAYQAVDRIEWEDGFCRRDIGWRALQR